MGQLSHPVPAGSCTRTDHVLTVDGLCVGADDDSGTRVLQDVALCVHPEERLGVVGETGSGKSMTMLSIMGLLPGRLRITQGQIVLNGQSLTDLTNSEYRLLRGRDISIVMQNARAALNPLVRIGKQMRNVYMANGVLTRKSDNSYIEEMLESVGLRDPDRVTQSYPHQLSGGMAQRVLIAMALGTQPDVVIADEPTSGLDTTVSTKVLNTLNVSIRRTGSSAIVVTHDLGVVYQYCDRVVVMKEGKVVETAATADFFDCPLSDYGKSLLAAHRWHPVNRFEDGHPEGEESM